MKEAKLSPPVAYQGSKQKFSKEIAELMNVSYQSQFYELCCGTGAVTIELVKQGFPVDKITMIDAGPWGLVWSLVGRGEFDLGLMKSYCDEVPKDVKYIGEHLRELSLTSATEDAAYKFLLLQAGAFGGRHVFINGDKWEHFGFRNYWTPTEKSVRRSHTMPMAPLPETLYQRMVLLCEKMQGVTGVQTAIEELQYSSEAVIYIDPPYMDTAKYGHKLDIKEFVKRLSCKCYVSEGVPLSSKAYLLSGKRKTSGITPSAAEGNKHCEWLSEFN